MSDKETPLEKAKKLAVQARTLADELFGSALPCRRLEWVTGTPPAEVTKTCIQDEAARPLTDAEQARGWARRPFYGYDQERMCSHCASYWFAERAAQKLERRMKELEQDAAEEARAKS